LIVRDDYIRGDDYRRSNVNTYQYRSATGKFKTLHSSNIDDDGNQLQIQNVDKNNKRDDDSMKGTNKIKNRLKIMISIVNYYLSQRLLYIRRKLLSRGLNEKLTSKDDDDRNNNSNRNNRNNNNNALKMLLMKAQMTMSKPLNIVKIVLTIIFSLVIRKLVWLRKTLIVEIPFSRFIDLLNTTPERINTVRITPSMLFFMLDGVHTLTRTVPLEPSLLDKLIHSRIEFYAPPAPKNVLGLLWTVGTFST